MDPTHARGGRMRGYVCKKGITWEDKDHWFWGSVLGFCGCYSEENFELVTYLFKKLWEAHKTDKGCFYYEWEEKPQDALRQELILFVFDSRGLVDHGSSVRGSWLSEKGKGIAKILFEPTPPTQEREECI